MGLRSSAAAAWGSSCKALKAADLDAAPSWASETFDARISAAPGRLSYFVLEMLRSYCNHLFCFYKFLYVEE